MKKLLFAFLLTFSAFAVAQYVPFDDGCGSCTAPTFNMNLRCDDDISGSNGDCYSSLEWRIQFAESVHDNRCALAGADQCVLEGDVEWNTIQLPPTFDPDDMPFGGYSGFSQGYRTWSTIGNQSNGIATSGVRTKTCAFAGPDGTAAYCAYSGGG